MSGAAGLLAEVRAAGARLGLDDGKLVVEVPRGALTAAQRELLVAHRAEIISLLAEPANDRTGRNMSRHVPIEDLPVALMLDFEERASIAEFDGGLDRAAAERLAWAEVTGEAEP